MIERIVSNVKNRQEKRKTRMAAKMVKNVFNDFHARCNKVPSDNLLVFGVPGAGRCHHPWDDLKPCTCGCKDRPLLMYEKNELYYCGGAISAVFAICPSCGTHTATNDMYKVIDDWNNQVVQKVVFK